MTQPLDLCPLCEATAQFIEKDYPPIGTRYGVCCKECECSCDFRELTKEAAAEKWNWRKPVSTLRSELEAARNTLLKHGYCGAGDHGTGDPEINRIDALAVAATPASDEVAWLIELAGNHGVPNYFQLEYDNDWTPDANKALRFARREDAQAYIHHVGWTEPKPVEHMWCSVTRPMLCPTENKGELK